MLWSRKGLKRLDPKYRHTFVEIDLKALRENFRTIKKLIPKTTEVLGVVKANAYGHGAVEISEVLAKEGVDQLGVAILEEAIELRNSGIKIPIVILTGVDQAQFSEVVRHKLTPVMWQPNVIQSYHDFLTKNNLRAPIFLKVDTGMHRLGINFNEFQMICKLLSGLDRFDIECLMSHFASSENPDENLTKTQIDLFQKAISQSKEFGLKIQKLSFSNSGGVINHLFEKYEENKILVRPGIILYGSPPDPKLESKITLNPVMHFKTAILDIKSIKVGESIGYCGTYRARQDVTIGVLPVGYADGYNRNLSNKAEVLVKGRRAPVVGNISMDLTTIDLSSISGVKIGDEVVLMGIQEKEEIRACEIAKLLNTISYEVLTSISARVPRIYKE